MQSSALHNYDCKTQEYNIAYLAKLARACADENQDLFADINELVADVARTLSCRIGEYDVQDERIGAVTMHDITTACCVVCN